MRRLALRQRHLDNPAPAQTPCPVVQLKKWLTEEMGEEVKNLNKDTVLIKTTEPGKANRVLEIRQELSKR